MGRSASAAGGWYGRTRPGNVLLVLPCGPASGWGTRASGGRPDPESAAEMSRVCHSAVGVPIRCER